MFLYLPSHRLPSDFSAPANFLLRKVRPQKVHWWMDCATGISPTPGTGARLSSDDVTNRRGENDQAGG